MSNPNDTPLPSSANLLARASAPQTNTQQTTLPSARSLGLEFPWSQNGQKKSALPPIQSGISSTLPGTSSLHRMPPQSSTYQQLPPSNQNSSSSLALPSAQLPKTFQNTPLQGLRTNNLGKRYMDDQQQYLPLKIQKIEKTMQHRQQQQHHQAQMQLLQQQQSTYQPQQQPQQRKVEEVEVTNNSFVCRFVDLPGAITLQKLPGCVKLDNQTITCSNVQQQIELCRQFILEYDRLKTNRSQVAR